MSPTIKERVTSLETILANFIENTSSALNRLEREMREFKNEMREFKNEMQEFKNEMQEFKNEMQEFKNEMQEFKNEMQEFKNEMQEFKVHTQKAIDELNKKFGDMTRKLGSIVEDLVFPCVPLELERRFGVELDSFAIREKRSRKNYDHKETKEFDAVGEYNNTIYLCYVKTTLREKDADGFEEDLESFRRFYPEHFGKKLIGIVASMNYSDSLLAIFQNKGLIYMAPSGYALIIKNSIDFQPKEWEV